MAKHSFTQAWIKHKRQTGSIPQTDGCRIGWGR